ncbi:MAG: WbqC family protein [Planctomycetes bacterium]|nr:WbqC family protein [Planctomycetota bacterium]
MTRALLELAVAPPAPRTAGRTVVILQPGYLPWLGYFDQMARADLFVHYDDAPYDRLGWRNRNRIKTAQGVRWLTVPVHASGQPPVREVRIDESSNWRRKHLETLRQAYARAPHAGEWLDAVATVLERPHRFLIDLDLALVELLRGAFGIDTPVRFSSEMEATGDRNGRLIDICRAAGADLFLEGEAGRSFIDEPRFASAEVAVNFHGYRHPEYRQLHGAFASHLSAIDLLLNEGPASGEILRSPKGEER